jgi:hypothetical protein
MSNAKRMIRQLMAATCLTAAGAEASTFLESSLPGADFGNTPFDANVLPAGTTTVQSVVGSPDLDYWRFENLKPGTYSYSLTSNNLSGYLDFYNSAIGYLGGTSVPASGEVTVGADGILIAGITELFAVTPGDTSYTFTLDIPNEVPEPSTAAMAAIGLGAAALAAKRRK